MRSRAIAIAIATLLAGGVLATEWGSNGASAPASSKQRSAQGVGRAKRLTREVTDDLQRILVKARQQLIELSRLPAVRTHDAEACDAEMAARFGSPRYTILGAANRPGDIYCGSPPLTSPANIADRPYFRRAIGTRGYAVGDFQIGRATGVKSLGMGSPTQGDNGSINGIVLSSMSLGWLDQHVGDKRPRGAVDVLVVDAHGTVLARAGRKQTPPGRNLGAHPLVEAMLADERGAGRFRVAGHRVASAFDAVRAAGGAVRVAVSVRR